MVHLWGILFGLWALSTPSLLASSERDAALPDPPGDSESPAPSLTSAEMVQREMDRRRELSFRLNETLRSADKLFQAEEWKASQERYREVLAETFPEGSLAGFHSKARVGLARSLAGEALAKEKAGLIPEAAGLMKEAADLDPNNAKLARENASMQEQAIRKTNPFPDHPAVTPELLEQTAKIKQLLSLARQLQETGQFRKAREALDDVLRIDPYNRQARRLIEEVEDARMSMANLRYEASRTKALTKVTEAWLPPPAPVIAARGLRGAGMAGSSRATEILRSLATIRLPELVFNEEPIRSAVAQLQKLSEQYDPNKKGLNFVLRLPAPAEGRDPEAANVSLELRDITLQTALKYLCEQVRGGEKLRFQVEENAVFLLPATETGGELESRSFSLPPSLATKTTDDPKKSGETILKDIGVNLDVEGASAVFFSDTGKLVVRNTPNELNKIEQRIQDAQGEPPQKQFEVETKFLQFTENDLKNFTFNLQASGGPAYPGPGTPGQTYNPGQATGGTDGLRGTTGLNQNGVSVVALQSLLDPTYPQDVSNQIGLNARVFGRGFSALLQLLQNAIGRDLVAAPRVTLADGKPPSKITISRQMFYPTSYTQPTVPNNDQGVGAGFILPSNPTGFEPRDIGVTLAVKGESTNIPRAVDLEFSKLEVEDFEGFVDYGSAIATVSFGEGPLTTGSATVVPPVSSPIGQAPYLVPIFSKRSLQSRVRLLHGETVGMGGLIAEAVQAVDDKVPLLGDLPLMGRLFRSEASQKVKSNLVIFCTMRIINPDGSPVFPDEETNPEFAQSESATMMPEVP